MQLSKVDTSAIQVFRFEGAHPEIKYRKQYEATFQLWKKVWGEYYATLPNPPELSLDQFTRQDEINSYFYNDKCMALYFCRFVDFSVIDHSLDSYFKHWRPDQGIEKLCAEGPMICIIGGLTVSDNFRRGRFGLDVKRLLIWHSVLRFLDSSAGAMPVTTRNAKNVNGEFYDVGAVAIRKNVVNFHAADLVDLVAVYRSKAFLPNDPEFRAVVDQTWRNRIVVPSLYDHRIAPARKAA